MVSGVMNANTNKNKIISTSFTFKEIVNMIPIIFDFKLREVRDFRQTLKRELLVEPVMLCQKA